MSSPNKHKVLVVGATGATGKHVVQQLLDQGQSVKAIVRSKDRMREALTKDVEEKLLTIHEASLLEMTDEQLEALVQDVDAVVSCLGHTMDWKGLFGEPKKLVTDAATRLTTAMSKTNAAKKKKFILMGSDGVAHPAGTDDVRPWSERMLISVIRYLIPPHRDNEGAADYLYSQLGADGKNKNIEWAVVRPTDLIDGEVSNYQLYEKPVGSLFGGGVATRANVAKAMVDLITNKDDLWNKWKFQMPVLHDAAAAAEEKE